jgi:heterodisulfide reductase subunit C
MQKQEQEKTTETRTLAERIREESGQDVSACYQCRKCAAGCPVAEYMDFKPHAIHRLIQYGLKDELLRTSAIWLCVGCETCGQRCPNDIYTSRVVDVLKQMAVAEGVKSGAKSITALHEAFLSGIRKRGRMHELSLILDMRLRSGGYFKDMKLGLQMFRKGKLSLFPEKIKDRSSVKALFDKAGGTR